MRWRVRRYWDRSDPDPDGLLDPWQNSAGNSNPLNRFLIRVYHPLLLKVRTGRKPRCWWQRFRC